MSDPHFTLDEHIVANHHAGKGWGTGDWMDLLRRGSLESLLALSREMLLSRTYMQKAATHISPPHRCVRLSNQKRH